MSRSLLGLTCRATSRSRAGILLGVAQAPSGAWQCPPLSAVAFVVGSIQAPSPLLGSFQAPLRSGDPCKGEDPKS